MWRWGGRRAGKGPVEEEEEGRLLGPRGLGRVRGRRKLFRGWGFAIREEVWRCADCPWRAGGALTACEVVIEGFVSVVAGPGPHEVDGR